MHFVSSAYQIRTMAFSKLRDTTFDSSLEAAFDAVIDSGVREEGLIIGAVGRQRWCSCSYPAASG
jgi:hypothetical protein